MSNVPSSAKFDASNASTLPMVFIHSAFDELGLTTSEFRVYCHLARRAKNGCCRPGHDSIAKICRLEVKTVRRVIEALAKRQLLKVEHRQGDTNVYHLISPTSWLKEITSIPANPIAPQLPDQASYPWGCQMDRGIGGQTARAGTQSAHHEVNPRKLIQEEDPKTQAIPNVSATVVSYVCVPAAAHSNQEERSMPVAMPSYVRKTQSDLWKQFETLWSQLKTEYRGDKKPAWQAFSVLSLSVQQLEALIVHRKCWEERSFASESGQSGWVPKPKQLANYLRFRQFESPVPEPRPLRSMPTPISGSVPSALSNTEAEQIAELKHLGIVGLDLLNGRAELEDDYAFAVDLVGTHRYSDILAHKDRLLEIHTLKAT
ncbi:MAG: helix-turn-helix domain-containing protein [Anaerolineae bacterium]|nr:helix-turn-helix domain-containing protein [Gloeobacterales cyanobacterium ES-bin-313]